MNFKIFAVSSFCFIISNAYASMDEYCNNTVSKPNGSKICLYNPDNAVKFAKANYKDDIQRASSFGFYEDNNCTNFLSQVLLSGLLKNTSMENIFQGRKFFEDRLETYKWYFDSKYKKSDTWAGANPFHNYVKLNKMPSYPYTYGGYIFEFVTRDYISSYDENGNYRSNGGALEVSKIRPGDIVFMDYSKGGKHYKEYLASGVKKKDIKTDGIMEHAFVITGVNPRIFNDKATNYNHIYVTSSTNTYDGKSLAKINESNGYAIEFYVYRPIGFIKK